MTNHLPDMHGLTSVTVFEHEPLAPRTTWKVGGPARWLVEVGARDSLVPMLARLRAAGLRWAVLGNGSNVLVSDAGFGGVVVVQVRGFRGGALRGHPFVADPGLDGPDEPGPSGSTPSLRACASRSCAPSCGSGSPDADGPRGGG